MPPPHHQRSTARMPLSAGRWQGRAGQAGGAWAGWQEGWHVMTQAVCRDDWQRRGYRPAVFGGQPSRALNRTCLRILAQLGQLV